MVLAHIAGLPVEEFLPALYGAVGVWAAIRIRVTGLLPRWSRARRRRA